MHWKLTSILAVLLAFVLSCSAPAPTMSQELTDEMRNMFEQIIDELDTDLQKKFRKAIKENRSTIRFTPDEFKRFRDNPVNPFDGIQDIDADELEGNIELKFELPSLRNRPLKRYERQQESMLGSFDSIAEKQSTSVVEIWREGKQVALGTVVDSSGKILTKASELGDKDGLKVILGDRSTVSAKVLIVDDDNDLAIIEIPRRNMVPVRWNQTQPLNGAFLVTPGVQGQALAMGTYSNTPRSLAGRKQGFLGVKPQTVRGGVMLVEVTPGDAGSKAGLRDGDIVVSIAKNQMTDVTDLVNVIRKHQPGDSVEIEFTRNGGRQKTTAVLADRNFSGERAARFNMMNRLGAIPSDRADRFPWVFQHDTPLFPEQCGGPIVDLDGRVIGINIARGGRAASYAIPSSHVLKVLPGLLRESIASRN